MVGMPILIDAASDRAMMGAANTPAAPAAAPFSNVRRSKPILRLVIWIPPLFDLTSGGPRCPAMHHGLAFCAETDRRHRDLESAAFLLPLILEHPSPSVKEYDW
jgi:hypothetical protein